MSTPSRQVPPEALEKAWFSQALNPELRVLTAHVEEDLCYLSSYTLPMLSAQSPSAAEYVQDRITPFTFIVLRATDTGFMKKIDVVNEKKCDKVTFCRLKPAPAKLANLAQQDFFH